MNDVFGAGIVDGFEKQAGILQRLRNLPRTARAGVLAAGLGTGAAGAGYVAREAAPVVRHAAHRIEQGAPFWRGVEEAVAKKIHAAPKSKTVSTEEASRALGQMLSKATR